jgi:hypothetical protein
VPAPRVPLGQRQEVLLLNESDVVVTDRRLVIGHRKTFMVEHLVSMDSCEQRPSPVGPVALIACGALVAASGLLLLAFGHSGGLVFALAGGVCVSAGLVRLRMPATPRLELTFSSGQRQVIAGQDPTFIGRVVKAIAEAEMRRG